MEEETKRELIEVEEGFVEVWKITASTIRRGKPYSHSRVERKCIWQASQSDSPCNRTFSRQRGASLHAKSHLSKSQWGKT